MFELKDCKYTAKQYIENFFYIVDENRNKVPFIFNSIQNKLWDKFGRKNLVLKDRKPGVSSQVLAMWDTACLFCKNTRAVVISHEKGATKRLLEKVYYYNDNLAIKPKLEKASENEIHYKETDSSFWIGTAGSRAFGRGDDITHLHISEYDWWENTDMLTGVLEACVKDAYIVIETTGNGLNSPMQKQINKVKQGLSDYVYHFYGWNENTKNVLPITENNFVLTQEEKELAAKYNLSNEQINWKRMKIKSMDRPELFCQEHPINDTEAFLASGSCYFNVEALKVYLTRARPQINTGCVYQ